jgi:methyl-accepting chemotaxis protein
MAVFVGLTVVACTVLGNALRQSSAESRLLMDRALAQLSSANAVAGQASGLQTLVHEALRSDPDALEATLKTLTDGTAKLEAFVASCGAGCAEIGAALREVKQAQQAVVEKILAGDLGLANELVMSTLHPRGAALQAAIAASYLRTEEGVTRSLAEQQRQDEVALLWQLGAVAVVLLVLSVLGWQLRGRITGQLGQIAGRLAEASEQVTASSVVVRGSSASLADGARRQSASLEETSASLEELSATTTRNAEDAVRAKAAAASARAAAETGGADIGELTEAMAAIKESSDGVARIVRTIDEIAFQTNILALNAAVEAARAGEAGMGFAVVATEVRSLAQRSAQAAQETTARLEDSVSKSQRGLAVTRRVSSTLGQIVEGARQVDALVAQITTASEEQRLGIGQASAAVSQVEAVTREAAASAEQSAEAAVALGEEGEALGESVADLLVLVRGSAQRAGQARRAPHGSSSIEPVPSA